MNATALALVLTGATCHAVWNVVAKKTGGGLVFVWLFGLVSIVVATPVFFWAWIVYPHTFDGWMWFAALISGLVHVIYSLVLQKAYRESDFAVVYPVARGSGPMFSVVAAILLLGEKPSILGYCAIAAILTGLVVATGAVDFCRREGAYEGSHKAHVGVLWGLATGGLIATYTIIDGWAIRSLGMAPIMFYSVGLVFRSVLLTPFAFRRRETLISQWKEHRRAIIIVGLLSPTAYLLVLQAVQLAPLSYVAPVREISMMIATFIGANVLKEVVKPSQIAGASIMSFGVIGLIWA